jgi:hypothetical protein
MMEVFLRLAHFRFQGGMNGGETVENKGKPKKQQGKG